MSGHKTLTIDGTPLLDFGVWTNGKNAWNAAEHDVATISVPGRSGDLVISNGRFKNISASYKCFMRRDFRHRFDDLRAFLLSKPGYRRVEDEREQEYFRKGRVVGKINVDEVLWTSDAGIFTLTFDFKPQRWMKRGEIKQTLRSTGSVYNPTYFDALPLMRVYGSGMFSIGEIFVDVDENTFPYIDIDCENQNAFCEQYNCNNLVTIDGDRFPKLPPGKTVIDIWAGIERIELTPRWWSI